MGSWNPTLAASEFLIFELRIGGKDGAPGKDRAEKKIPREPGEPAEIGFVIVTAVVAALTFAFVFCQQR